MATSVEEFKKAFAGKAADDDLTVKDKEFANVLKRLDNSIKALGENPVANNFRSGRDKVAQMYRDARGQNGLSNKETVARLNEVFGQAEAVIARADDAAKKVSWTPFPLVNPVQAAPGGGTPLVGIPRMDPDAARKWQEEDLKKQEQGKKEADDALEQARKWLVGMPMDALRKLTFPEILATIREKFPAVVDLPKPKTLMDTVEKVLWDRGYMAEKGALGDPMKLAMQKLIAAYISSLPKDIKPVVTPAGISLVVKGAASMPAEGGADAKPGDKKSEKFEFKNKNYTIDVTNQAWKALDPAMRAKWKSLNDEASGVKGVQDKIDEIKNKLSSWKKEWESKDGTSKLELEAKLKDLEAEFKGRWDTLQKSIDATAKVTTDGIKATITEAKKQSKDEKVGAELELKFKEMSVGLKAFANTPDLKTALEVTGSAEKITAKIEAEAIKSGTVVTLQYEKSLKEVKEQLELQIKQGDASLAAKLSKEAVKLEDKLKELKDAKTKDFKDVQSLEDGLQKLKFEVEASYKKGDFKVSASGRAVSGGEVGGKAKVELMLDKGISFLGKGQSISFSADVSNKGYEFALTFSVGNVPDLKDVHKANQEADKKIRELYKLVGDTKIRSLDDASKIQKAFSDVMSPLKDSVDAMKKVDKKKYALELGIKVTGEFPAGGTAPPPVAGFSLAVHF